MLLIFSRNSHYLLMSQKICRLSNIVVNAHLVSIRSCGSCHVDFAVVNPNINLIRNPWFFVMWSLSLSKFRKSIATCFFKVAQNLNYSAQPLFLSHFFVNWASHVNPLVYYLFICYAILFFFSFICLGK